MDILKRRAVQVVFGLVLLHVLFGNCILLYAKADEIKIEDLKNLLEKVPKYYVTYYTEDSLSELSQVMEEINQSELDSLASEQIIDYYTKLELAIDGLKYKTSDVPQIYISTSEGNGNSLEKADGYTKTEIVIVDTEGNINNENSSGQIKVRGNSTASAPKKPFKIKFDKKENLFGMGKSKKWVLLANCFDPTLMRNYLAFHLASNLNLDYTSECKYVDVWVDGVFKGNYLLIEPIEKGDTCVDIDTDKGDFLIECEETRWEADVTYLTTSEFQYRFSLHEPEEYTEEQLENVKSCLNNFETLLVGGDFNEIAKVIDLDSFVDCYIVNEYIKNLDFGFSSVYFYCKDGILYAGPIWDFDLSSGNVNNGVESYKIYNNFYTTGNSYESIWCNKLWYAQLMKMPEFNNLIVNRYKELQPEFDNITKENGIIDTLLKDYLKTFEANYNEAGWKVNKQYSVERPREKTFEANVEWLRDWLINRNIWLSEHWNILRYEEYEEVVQEAEIVLASGRTDCEELEAALAADVYAADITQVEIDDIVAKIRKALKELEEKEYTITFDSNGGSAVKAVKGTYGSMVEAPAAPTRKGYKFTGWYSDRDLTEAYEFTIMPSDNITLYAGWSADTQQSTSESPIETPSGQKPEEPQKSGEPGQQQDTVGIILSATYKKPVPNKNAKAVTQSPATDIVLYTKKYKTASLMAEVTGSKENVTWSSSNSKVATVSSDGKVTAKKKGTAYITAEVGGVTVSCRITVKKASLSVKVNKKTVKDMLAVKKGKTYMLKTTVTPYGKITYKVKNNKILKVSKGGKLTALRKGSTTVTVSVNGMKKKIKVKVE